MIGQTISHYKILEKLGEGGMIDQLKSQRSKTENPLAIGIAIGAGIGVAIENIAVGVGCGVALGVAIGTIIGRKRKDDGKK